MVFFQDCWCPINELMWKRELERGRVSYRLVNAHQCPLLKAVLEQDWDTVAERCESNPHETFRKSRRGDHRTALQFATSRNMNAPVWILQVLLEANPHAVLECYMPDATPLHYICDSDYCENPRLVQLFVDTALQMLQKYPETRMNVSNKSPLLLAARRASPVETLHNLLNTRKHTRWIAPWTGGEAIESMACFSFASPADRSDLLAWWWQCHSGVCDNELPLQTLWRQNSNFLKLSVTTKQRMLEVSQLLLLDQRQSLPAPTDDPTVRRWTQCLLLLREHCTSPTRLVHHVACLYRPIPGLLQLICKLYPDLLLAKDKRGRMPLHAVLHQQRQKRMLHTLVDILVQAQSESLAVIDESSHLYPCLLAASQDASLETIFQMLTTYPQVLEMQRQP